ncbi:MAG: hypothetical protein Q9208_008056 [Pyrenodesmia sp. 3 TL-2023]
MNASSLPHAERTAAEKREADLHHIILSKIDQVNDNIRLLRFQVSPTKRFRPGQWLDVYLPGIRQAGGFTITSTPQDAQWSGKTGYLELAVQKSPNNPPAAWLWRPEGEILGSGVIVRIGGSFVWPPPGVDLTSIKRLVFVAGGVGIKYVRFRTFTFTRLTRLFSPLISILTHLYQQSASVLPQIQFLYTTRFPKNGGLSSILFFDRLHQIFKEGSYDRNFTLFLTQCSEVEKNKLFGPASGAADKERIICGRLDSRSLLDAVGPVKDRKGVVVYVCGVPSMTDEFVSLLRGAEGMDDKRVLCEKWW